MNPLVRGLVASIFVFAAAALFSLTGCGGGEAESGASTAGSRVGKHLGGAEESIEGFGSEAGPVTRLTLLGAFRSYLEALGSGDYVAVCSKLSAEVKKSLAQLTRGRPNGVECRRTLPALLSPRAAVTALEQAKGSITRVRVKGDRAFVVFHAPGARLYMMAMIHEGRGWKASSAAASVLAPSPLTLRG